jgi:DNA helicase II / ATP-dependent DNA helicase PcrA
MTRARRHLSISWAAARNPGGRASRRPSRFLDGLRPETARDSAPSAPKSRRSRRPLPTTCRTCGAPLTVISERKVGRCSSCPPTYDEALFERLRAWRLETARADAIPAFTVFTDATLVAIAEAMPRSPEELLRVSGVGESKRARYGAAVLGILASTGE